MARQETTLSAEPTPGILLLALSFAAVLDALEIPYVVTGSLASSVHGEPRSTNDVDLVVDLKAPRIKQLITALGDDYYIPTDAALAAIMNGGSFNIIHLTSGFKVDLFVVHNDAFDAERIGHRQRVTFGDLDQSLWVDRAEFTVVRKLEGFRRGDEIPERQWRDTISVLRMGRGRLDIDLMRLWSARIGVADLLERALVAVAS